MYSVLIKICFFTVIIRNVLLIHDEKEVLPLNTLISAIQNARRILAREEEGIPIEESTVTTSARADKQKRLELDYRIDLIQEALFNFKSPGRALLLFFSCNKLWNLIV